ncbi:hypothetical protein DIPPA_61874 [Diplonema papillatum]|nr:hypothetical protein DIPPA_61874 [Diplonema papillatum]
MHARRALRTLPSLMLQCAGTSSNRSGCGNAVLRSMTAPCVQAQSRHTSFYAGKTSRCEPRRPLALQLRGFHRTRPLNGVPALGFIGLWVAKKAIILIASYLYGFKKLYGRLLRFHDRRFPARVQPYTKWALRHTFDGAIKLVSLVDFRARKRVVAAGAQIPTDAPPVVYPPKESLQDLKDVAEKAKREKERLAMNGKE